MKTGKMGFDFFGWRGRIFFLSFAFAVSCGDGTLIPERDFIAILTDIYLSKSYFSSEGIHHARWRDTVPYNHHIVERYGYKWAQFDSTVSWYCSHPKKYRDVYERVIADLSELDKKISEELDPPTELWTGKREYCIPADGDSVPAGVLLKGVGSYIVSAKIMVGSQDESLNPRLEFYLWRSDTTATGVRDTLWTALLRKDGLMYEYRMERTLLPGNEFTHIKGNWLQYDRNGLDSTRRRCAEVRDISVYHIPKKF